MFAQTLAMIGRDDDERRPRERREPVEEKAERVIDVRRFAVVGLRRGFREVLLRRTIRRMRI